MFENSRAWSTLCDCIDIASRTIRAIADPSFNVNPMMCNPIPQHASRRDNGYQNTYPHPQMYGQVYPTPQYQPSYPQPYTYGTYVTPYIPGKSDPNYGLNPNAQHSGSYQTYAGYYNPQYQSQAPSNGQGVTCSFGYGGRPAQQNLGGYYGY